MNFQFRIITGLYKRELFWVKFLDLMNLPFLLIKDFFLANTTLLDRIFKYPYLLSKASNDFVIDQQGFIKITKRVLVSYLITFLVFSGTGLVFLFNPFGTKTTEAAWFNDNWAYRKALTIDAAQVAGSSNLTDFPVMISLTSDASLSSNAQSDGDDIFFVDQNSTRLDHEIEYYSAGTLVAWIRVPSLPATTNSTIYMYYGNPSAVNQQKSTSVWNSGYKMVQHLEETSGTTTSDSTINGNTGTKLAATEPNPSSSGQVDGAQDFDGTDDQINMGTGVSLANSSFTISAWAKRDGVGTMDTVYALGDSASLDNLLVLGYRDTNQYYCGFYADDAGSSSTYADTNWHYLTCTYDASTNARILYRDGVAISQDGNPASADFQGSGTAYIGANPTDGGEYFNGPIDEVRISTSVLSADWLLTEYNNQSSPGTFLTTGSEEKGPSPVAYWKFDDGQGTTTQDSTTNNNDGTLNTSPQWTTEDMCISGKCLKFTGTSNQNVTVPASTSLQPNRITISVWVKFNAASTFSRLIGSVSENYTLNLESDDVTTGTKKIRFSTAGIGFIQSNNGVPLNEWIHVVGTNDGSIQKLYINGVLQNDTLSSGTPMSQTSETLYLGNFHDGTFPLNGYMDEFKIYNFALTDAQIKANYNARSNPEGTSSVLGTNTQNMPAALSDGLVGYWKTDESSGNASDSSGNSLTLTNNSSTAYTPGGKFGYAGIFVAASSDYFSTATTINGVKTVAFWTYNASTTDDYISLTSGAYITSSSGTISATGFTSPSIYVNGALNGTLTSDTWQHVVITSNTAINADQFEIGRANSSYNNGRIDETRLYNRPLTPAEISQLYNWTAGPIAYWRMDEGTGSTTYDSSGYGNNSTSISGSPGWTSGVYGKTINFDGTNDAVTIDESTTTDFGKAEQSYTVMAWVKNSTSNTSTQPLLSKNASSNAPGVFTLRNNWSTAQPEFIITNSGWTLDSVASGTTNIRDGKWHHLAGIRNEVTNQVYIYVDGKLEGTATDNLAGTDISSDQPVIIGGEVNGGTYWPGPIDDVKLYNYARTASQIVEDMNAGHPAPGSPVGTPVGFWKFNEGVNDTCSGGSNDVCNSGSGGNTYDGTSTATRTNSGKLSRALDFDGTDDVVTITNAVGIDFNDNLSNFTFSSWIYPDSDGEADSGTVFNKGSNTYLRVDSQGTTDLDLECNLDRATTDTNVNVTDAITTAAWNHAACTWDGTTLSVVVNGQVRGSSTSGSGAIAADTNDLLIGGATANNFDGKIDEFKVYNSALTASQLGLDANAASAQILGATGDNSTAGATNAESQEYCIPGDSSTCTVPVGRWDFEKQSSNNQTHYDISGNANNCTDFNGAALVIGKIGKATNVVDSVGGSMNCGQAASLDNLPASGMTIEGWIFPDSEGEFGQGMIARKSGYYVNGWWFNFNGGGTNSLAFNSAHATVDLTRTTADNAVTLNAWNHVALTWTGSTTATTVKIYINGQESSYNTTTNGSGARSSDATEDWVFGDDGGGTASFDGKIDQFRAFNYVRTPAQIAYDYNRGAPIAHWKMDECQGTTINNSSGPSSFAGTLVTAGTVGTCTSSGQWFNGATGKRNYSFEFTNDNTRAYAPLGSSIPTGDFTYSAWIKPTTTSVFDSIFAAESATTGDTDELMIFLSDTPNKLTVRLNGSDAAVSDQTIADGEWILVTVTRVGSTITIYLNGTANATGTDGTALTFNSACNLSIGADQTAGCDESGGTWDGWFDGLIDDARVYNYGLTATQVKTLFNDGTVRYGPVTGAP